MRRISWEHHNATCWRQHK